MVLANSASACCFSHQNRTGSLVRKATLATLALTPRLAKLPSGARLPAATAKERPPAPFATRLRGIAASIAFTYPSGLVATDTPPDPRLAPEARSTTLAV